MQGSRPVCFYTAFILQAAVQDDSPTEPCFRYRLGVRRVQEPQSLWAKALVV